VSERITYKLCTLTFRCLNGLAPQYLNYSSQSLTLSHGWGCDRHQLLNWLCCACDDPWSATAPLLSPRCAHGTVCLTHCTDCHHWNNSRKFWKVILKKSHLRNKTVRDCKALLKRLVLPTALYKLFKLHYITLIIKAGSRKVNQAGFLMKQDKIGWQGWASDAPLRNHAPHYRQLTMPAPHNSISTDWVHFQTPDQQCQSTEGNRSTFLQ